MVNKLVQTPMDFAATPQKALFNQNVTVTWKIPNDEATHKDWIGMLQCTIHLHDVLSIHPFVVP